MPRCCRPSPWVGFQAASLRAGAPASGSGHGVPMRRDAPSRLRDARCGAQACRRPQVEPIRRDRAHESHRPARGGGRQHCDGQGRGATDKSHGPSAEVVRPAAAQLEGRRPVARRQRLSPQDVQQPCRTADAAREPAPEPRRRQERAWSAATTTTLRPCWASVTPADPRGPSARWPARAMLPI